MTVDAQIWPPRSVVVVGAQIWFQFMSETCSSDIGFWVLVILITNIMDLTFMEFMLDLLPISFEPFALHFPTLPTFF